MIQLTFHNKISIIIMVLSMLIIDYLITTPRNEVISIINVMYFMISCIYSHLIIGRCQIVLTEIAAHFTDQKYLSILKKKRDRTTLQTPKEIAVHWILDGKLSDSVF